MRCIELFGGAGGLALGIDSVGFHTETLVEYDRETCVTLRHNKEENIRPVSSWNIIEADVRNIDYSIFPGELDLLSGGPPCQPFSLGGKGQAFNDSRDMFPEAVRAVRELRPKSFIFENVKGLLRESFSSYFKYIELQLSYPSLVRHENETWIDHLSQLERLFTSGHPLEYRVVTRLLNAANYGVPQKRERVIFVGFREDLNMEWSFPNATHSRAALLRDKWITGEYWDRHKVPMSQRVGAPLSTDAIKVMAERADAEGTGLPWRTVRDVISDLPDPRSEHNAILNHKFNPGAKVYPGHTGSEYDEPSKTIKAGSHGVPGGENMLAYPDGSVRYFTVRESARIQMFPDEYIFPVSWSESMRQLGNAVPVGLATAVAGSVKTLLIKKDEPTLQPA
jgi:DNA (cytosine-5)-methyltransferase 1